MCQPGRDCTSPWTQTAVVDHKVASSGLATLSSIVAASCKCEQHVATREPCDQRMVFSPSFWSMCTLPGESCTGAELTKNFCLAAWLCCSGAPSLRS